MSDVEGRVASPLERAVWQIERGIRWQQDVNTKGGMQITVAVLKKILKEAAAEAGQSKALVGFKPASLDEVLAKAKELSEVTP